MSETLPDDAVVELRAGARLECRVCGRSKLVDRKLVARALRSDESRLGVQVAVSNLETRLLKCTQCGARGPIVHQVWHVKAREVEGDYCTSLVDAANRNHHMRQRQQAEEDDVGSYDPNDVNWDEASTGGGVSEPDTDNFGDHLEETVADLQDASELQTEQQLEDSFINDVGLEEDEGELRPQTRDD